MLIIRALAGSGTRLNNLSESDDTKVLEKALQEQGDLIDVGHAGTAMRFLAAYLATVPGDVILTGSPRMKERPIGPLVAALRELGARISYLDKEGFPPLHISGAIIAGGDIEIAGGISSQFISALMMIGPALQGGLHITLMGEVVSVSYLHMTLSLMNGCGAGASFDGRHIVVPGGHYEMEAFTVESDWSGASYWYQMAALLPGSELHLPGLERESLQGDAVLAGLFEPLGVQTAFREGGVTLTSRKVQMPAEITYDFSACPDLVQTCAVTFCALGIPFRFTGTRTLRIKETDRIAALEKEMKKLGYLLFSDPAGEWFAWSGKRSKPVRDPVIETYNDHRMAMAFAPLAIPLGRITIEDPAVVSKSYPGFWKDLETAGFGISS